MNKISEQLRAAILDIRRKPYPISDLIPLLSRAADEIDNLNTTLKYTIDIGTQALDTIKIVGDERCQQRLMTQGKPYPRTCEICKLGPCKL
jgi:hypothetical protein